MLTPEFFNILIIVNLIVGVVLASWRLRKDLSRFPSDATLPQDDTQPRKRNSIG